MSELEQWKSIEGYENIYEVSSLGRVKSLNFNQTKQEGILKNRDVHKGYLSVHLAKKGVNKNKTIHRLVAIAFIPNPNNKTCVNHINGIKNDNRIENLEWCTSSENQIHAFSLGLKIPVFGEKHHNSRLTEKQILEIRKSNLSQLKLSKIYGVCQPNISAIKTRKLYKHII